MFWVCVLDVSPHMQQQTTLGLTLLECAKSAVEHLISTRTQEGHITRDQYMLVITSYLPLPPPSSPSSPSPSPTTLFPSYTQTPSSWYDTPSKFLSSLKSLTPLPSLSPSSPPSFTYLSSALTTSLDLINKFSRPNGIDNFGKGRIPHYNEPAIILLFTTDLTSLPPSTPYQWNDSTTLGSTLSLHPYRWDQRVMPCVMRIGKKVSHEYQSASASLNQLSGVSQPTLPSSALTDYLTTPATDTGGEVLITSTLRHLLSHIDSLATKPVPSLFLHLHSLNPALPSLNHVPLYVKGVSTWPIPETYLPTPSMSTLPPRPAHPTLFYGEARALPSVLVERERSEGLPSLDATLPVDQYTLDLPSSLASVLLSDDAGTGRWVTVEGSAPFAVLTFNRRLNKPLLYLLPYDFPTFLSLLTRIDQHLRSLPLTSSSLIAHQSAPHLYRDLTAFLSKIPHYCAAPLQQWVGKQGRIGRLEVKVSDVGVLSQEVQELMKGWKERVKTMMAIEKEAAEKSKTQPTPTTSSTSSPPPPSKKRKRVVTPSQSEVESLISQRDIRLLPPPSTETIGEGLTSLFLVPDPSLLLSTWRELAFQPFDSLPPVLCHSFPAPVQEERPLRLRPRSARVVKGDGEHSLQVGLMGDFQRMKQVGLRSVEEEVRGFGSPFRRRVEEEGVEEKDVLESRSDSGKQKGKNKAKDKLSDWVAKRNAAAAHEFDFLYTDK